MPGVDRNCAALDVDLLNPETAPCEANPARENPVAAKGVPWNLPTGSILENLPLLKSLKWLEQNTTLPPTKNDLWKSRST
jgi:hypothetical protein